MNKQEISAFAKTARRLDKDTVVAGLCAGKTVLDVGCIGQDRNFRDENWLHNKIRKLASEVDGVDILVNEIMELKKQGYSIFTIEELQASGKRYEVIMMADVIEHVDNPVEFLRFYSSFLLPGGKIFVSTPNSNRANNFINILFNNNYSVNPEHTCWFCPRTFAEVADRAKLNILEFHWANHYYKKESVKGFYQRFKFSIANYLIGRRSNFSPNMLFILSRP